MLLFFHTLILSLTMYSRSDRSAQKNKYTGKNCCGIHNAFFHHCFFNRIQIIEIYSLVVKVIIWNIFIGSKGHHHWCLCSHNLQFLKDPKQSTNWCINCAFFFLHPPLPPPLFFHSTSLIRGRDEAINNSSMGSSHHHHHYIHCIYTTEKQKLLKWHNYMAAPLTAYQYSLYLQDEWQHHHCRNKGMDGFWRPQSNSPRWFG